MVTYLDERKEVEYLTVYIARGLDCVPNVKVEDLELFCLTNKLRDLNRWRTCLEAAANGQSSLAATISKADEL